MSKLPVVSGREAIHAFSRLGYEVDHQTGSHVILRHGNRLTAGSSYRTTKNWRKGPCEA